MSDAGEPAGHATCFAELESRFIPLGATWVDDAGRSGSDEKLRSIGKGEEGIAGGDECSGAIQCRASFFDGDSTGCDTVHLAGTGAKQGSIAAKADGIRFQVFHDCGQDARVSTHGV